MIFVFIYDLYNIKTKLLLDWRAMYIPLIISSFGFRTRKWTLKLIMNDVLSYVKANSSSESVFCILIINWSMHIEMPSIVLGGGHEKDDWIEISQVMYSSREYKRLWLSWLSNIYSYLLVQSFNLWRIYICKLHTHTISHSITESVHLCTKNKVSLYSTYI